MEVVDSATMKVTDTIPPEQMLRWSARLRNSAIKTEGRAITY